MRDVLIGGAVRTPVGDLGGSLSRVSAVRLGRTAAEESLRRSGLQPEEIEEVIFGNVLQAGQGQNPARQVGIGAGVPQHVPGYTVNKVCGSGLKAIELGWQSILLGRARAVLAGGIESMSQAPYVLPTMRAGAGLGHNTVIDTVITDGLTDSFTHYHMGVTAEIIAERYGIGREEQDRFALESHRKAVRAAHLFAEEIAPVSVREKKQKILVGRDEHPRADTSLERLAALRVAFQPDGTVTAGNASGINDGAAAVVLCAAEEAGSFQRGEAVLFRDAAAVGCAPETMGLGPIGAIRRLLERSGLRGTDVDLWEINEAFAASSLAINRELEIDPGRLNVNGGAIALGHPIGASGTRVVVTLIHEMKRRGARWGIAALCIGGGMGIAALLENA